MFLINRSLLMIIAANSVHIKMYKHRSEALESESYKEN